MRDLTAVQKICAPLAFVFACALIWTSAESISMSFEFFGFQKMFPYILAVAMISLGSFGLYLFKRAIAEDGYAQNKGRSLIFGLLFFMMAIIPSIAGSVHNLYFRGTNSKMQEVDLNVVHRDLAQAAANAESIVKPVVSTFERLVEAKLDSVIKECRNLENPGCGPAYQTKKRELDSILGVSIPLVSARDIGSRPSDYAIGEFADSVRRVKSDISRDKKAATQEITNLVSSMEFKNLLTNLKTFKDNYSSEMRDEISRLLKRAFAVRRDLAKQIDLLTTTVGASKVPRAETLPERPPSTDMQKVDFFWGEALSGADASEGGLIYKSAMRWAILFGVLFEVAFTAFFYAGVLARRED
jgi:hypothetical protein